MLIAIIEPVGGHGGMDHYDYGLAQGLAENGVQVHIHTCAETEVRTVSNVFTHTSFGDVWNTSNKLVKLWRYLGGHWKALRSAKKNGCTVVHLHFFSFDWLNVLVTAIVNLFGFRTILTIHDVSDFRGGGNTLARKYILSSFDHLIVHNRFSLKQLSNFHQRKNVSVIPHGHYLHSVEQLKYEPDVQKPLRLLFFGQIKKVKGLDVLLKALKLVVNKNDKVHLQIAGKVWHDDITYYEQLIQKLGIGRYITKEFRFVPNEEVATFFKEADVVVLPYRQIYQSGVLLLSMSYGRAVITSDLEPFVEVLDDGQTGLVFRSEDEESLAEVILKAMDNRSLLHSIAERASGKLKEEFDWNKIGRETLQAYACNE